jgi:hypothetical protein
MIEPTRSITDPERVTTLNGVTWTRRDASRGGRALYAPERVAAPPRLAMSTLPELDAMGALAETAAA